MDSPSFAGLIVALGAAASIAQAEPVTVFSGGAVKSAFDAAGAQWERASGHAVRATFAPAGDLRRRLAAGERADILVLPRENIEALERDGVVEAGSRRDLGAVAIGVAVRKGAPVPDISTPEALKRTLLEAKSVIYMDPQRGTSGKYFDEVVLPRLGIRDAVRAKSTLGDGGLIAQKVANGEVQIAFQQMTELLPVQGVTVVGRLPKALEKLTVYSGAVMKGAPRAREARALLDFLVSPEGRRAFLERGFSVPE